MSRVEGKEDRVSGGCAYSVARVTAAAHSILLSLVSWVVDHSSLAIHKLHRGKGGRASGGRICSVAR
jgi:hypothetical protein